MIPPPFTTDPRADDVLDADYADVRVPAAFGLVGLDGNTPAPRPVGRPCPADPAAAHPSYGRHVFDAVLAEEGDKYGDDDELLPPRFRLALACLRCGAVVRFEGTLNLEREHVTEHLEPVPIKAGPLVAQQVSPSRGWASGTDTWTVYLGVDEAGQPRRVGVVAWARGPRGRAYYVGRFGLPYTKADDEELARQTKVEAATPIGVLRKLAKHVDAAEAYLARIDADLAAWRETVRAGQARRLAELEERRARELAGLPRVVPIRQEPPA